MSFVNEHNKPVSVKSIDAPISSEYYWTLDMKEKDFMLNKLMLWEEIETQTLTFMVGPTKVEVPSGWNTLIYSEDTGQLDIIAIYELTRGAFTPFIYNHKLNKILAVKPRIVDYTQSRRIVMPVLHKTSMLCYPVGRESYICISNFDGYSKYLKDCTLGDILV